MSEGISEISEVVKDKDMLLPETRVAVNEFVKKNWNELLPQLQEIPQMQAALDMEVEGLLPFKDVHTNLGTQNITEQQLKERFSNIVEMMYAEGGLSEENMHAVKMGYWDAVKYDRMSDRELRQANLLKMNVSNQINDDFIQAITRPKKMNFADGSYEEDVMKLILEDRLTKISKKNVNKITLAGLKLLFKVGALNSKLARSVYDTENNSEGCIASIFDTLRDKTKCLWNNANGGLCDE